ncbi:hypothetical protein UVI_02030330 [Ustilaginoidea virens]|uniref:Cation-transporting ATPase n=1 Tax=Ustilaginoidea virens TaxID=1159556 RepID=A0A1B5L418_USTVR|nr:hypothetical protein UVI_02030330 [Ustilaginoidea virens]
MFAGLHEAFVRRSVSEIGDLEFGVEDDSVDNEYSVTPGDYMLRRCSSTISKSSVHARLLRRDSMATVTSAPLNGRSSQKIYMANEDLTIVVAGLAYLLFRWLPRWYITIVGRSCPLKDCQWAVVENQWSELVIIQVKIQEYGRPVSSVFGVPEKPYLYGLDDENDPLVDHLRSLDYRYIRLYFHPTKDKFVMSSGWKDPEWTDARIVRAGLSSDEKFAREVVFGSNLIDIEQKTVAQLMVEEPPAYWRLHREREYAYRYELATYRASENQLTEKGESVPVSKLPATDDTFRMMDLAASSVAPEIARHFLYCGTKIIRTRRPQEDQDGDAVALALVVRTAFNTTKGALVRSMLFPKPSGFKFYRDSFRYISIMALIAALGFIASFVNFLRMELAWHLIITRALDLITIVVPPALPATLTIGTSFALSRLKKKQIFCISPQRVNVGGKLDIMCFDKTGTLTEDGLDVLGLRIVSETDNTFTDLLSRAPLSGSKRVETGNKGAMKAALYTMATCHSLRAVDGELVGDPLDKKMFEFTGWSFEEGSQGAGEGESNDQRGLTPSVARPPNVWTLLNQVYHCH